MAQEPGAHRRDSEVSAATDFEKWQAVRYPPFFGPRRPAHHLFEASVVNDAVE
jgi:hypothetical protein